MKTRLKQLREEKGFTQSRVAKALGTSPSAINLYEMEITVPSVRTMIKIAKFYGVSIDYIVYLSDARYPQWKSM